MSITTLFILAAGLAMDAFAVSISDGICYRQSGIKGAFAAALTFGLFQGIMPILGYSGGRFAAELMAALDHWIALVLLCFIGGSMIVESREEIRPAVACAGKQRLAAGELMLQGVATSIDAFAVGISLAALRADIGQAACFIGVVTFAFCFLGTFLGRRFGMLLGRRAKTAGGILLIGIGLKIFTEHTLF